MHTKQALQLINPGTSYCIISYYYFLIILTFNYIIIILPCTYLHCGALPAATKIHPLPFWDSFFFSTSLLPLSLLYSLSLSICFFFFFFFYSFYPTLYSPLPATC